MAIFFETLSIFNISGIKNYPFSGLFSAIRHTGNVNTFLKKVYYILKSEGFKGITSRLSKLNRNNYTKWITQFDELSDEDLKTLLKKQSEFLKTPLFSVILPVYNPKPRWLIQAIESVCSQTYTNWELCIADDASTNPGIKEILIDYQKNDPRIKIVFREKNGHISACSNSALEIASGEWIVLLDHDDLVSPFALYHAVEALHQNDDIRLIYSDEDKINRSGKRSEPYFKCDWNRDLFYSHNMLNHLGIYHADLVHRAGGFRIGFEGSQDYDLALRCIELISNEQIHHIPRVLYHWRVHKKSTALSVKSKPYAMQAGERALNEHFQRINIKAKAELIGYGYKVSYALPEKPPKVSIIILTRNGFSLLSSCIQSIKKLTTYPNYEIIVVDNGTNDPETLEFLKQLKGIDDRFSFISLDQPFNYSSLNNQAVKRVQGEYIVFLNNDVQVISADWLSEMMGIAIQPWIGAVGAKLYYPDNTIQHAGIIVGMGSHGVAACAHNRLSRGNKGYLGRASLINSFSAVTAACMLVRKSLFEKMNGFDEVNLPVAYNDVDFCLRLQEAGYRNVFTPYAELYHFESASRGKKSELAEQKRQKSEIEYFKRRWSHLLAKDPAYNPNLTLQFSDFSLAWPPRI